MRGAVHVFFAALLGLLASGLAGCSGGLGEGGDNAGPQPPPNFKSPVYQGQLNGKVMFEQGFLHHGILSAPASGKTTRTSLDRDRAFYRSLTARIAGNKGRKRVKVQEDGSFDFETIRRGDYLLEIVGTKGLLASCPITLDGKSRMHVTVRVIGQDYADLDKDKDRGELVVEKEINYKSDLVIFRRVFPPVGDVRTYLEDGSVEVLGPDGYVKIFGADGQVEYRFDPSNRFVDEELEAETGQRKRKKSVDRQLPKDPLAAKVSGQYKAPLVLGVTATGVSSTHEAKELVPGDLARLEVKTDANGGTDVGEVTAVVYGPAGSPQKIGLVDDGGQEDRKTKWPGMQSSLDRKKGDGVFTFPLLLDAPTYRFLAQCQIVVTAKNARYASRPASFHLYLPPAPEEMANAGTLAARVAGVRIAEDPRGSNRFRAEVKLKDALPDGTTAMLVGPTSFRRLLTPFDGGARLASTPAALDEPGVYTVLLTDPAGDVFYASFRRRYERAPGGVARSIAPDDPPSPVPTPRDAAAPTPEPDPEEAE